MEGRTEQAWAKREQRTIVAGLISMEALLRLLPGPQPLLVRYGVSVALVLLTFALRLGIEDRVDPYGFVLFIPAIMASALMYDRGSGFLALAASIAGVALVLPWGTNPHAHVAAIASFAVVGAAVVLISEGLHRALEEAHKAEREKDLLLKEMTHRVKNKFAMILSIVGLQARQAQPETRAALEAIAGRVRVIANVHEHLQLAKQQEHVDMCVYLNDLCRSLGDAMRELRPVTVSVSAEHIMMRPEHALSVGLIANELITNAYKYAFGDGRIGHIEVSLTRANGTLDLSVADNGKGCAEHTPMGLGTRLVELLASQLGGNVSREALAPGCKVVITAPVPP
jgi:two-component sensor histidine kinase